MPSCSYHSVIQTKLNIYTCIHVYIARSIFLSRLIGYIRETNILRTSSSEYSEASYSREDNLENQLEKEKKILQK